MLQTKNIINYLLSLLIVSLPFSYVSGPFLPDLIFVIFGIFLLFNLKYFFNFIIQFKFLNIIILFWIVITIESFLSNYKYVSFTTSFLYLRFLLGSLGIAVFFLKNEKILLYFGYSLVLCFVILIFDGYFQYLFKINIIGIPMYEVDRLNSFFGDELKLGSFLSRFMPLFFFFIFKYKNKKILNIYFALFLLIALDILIFLSGERVAFAYLTMTTLIMIVLLKEYKLIRLITFIFSLILIVIISNSSKIVKNRMITQTIEQFGITNEVIVDTFNFEDTLEVKDKIYAFTPHHHSHYVTAIEMFKKNPLIGTGTKTFRFECKIINPKSCSTHPHNSYIQLLGENGILGTLPIIFIFLSLCFIFLKDLFYYYYKNKIFVNDTNLCLFLCFFITLWPIIPTGSFYNNWLNTIYYLPLSIFIYVNFKNNKYE